MGDVGGVPLPQEDALPAEGAEGGAQLTDCETDGAAEADAEMDAPEPSGLPPKGRMPCRPWPRLRLRGTRPQRLVRLGKACRAEVPAAARSAKHVGKVWSGRRESNPHNQLGRLGLYH